MKSKAGGGFGDPLEMVTPLKVARLRRAASAWLARHPADRIRFDVAAERAGRLEVLKDAF